MANQGDQGKPSVSMETYPTILESGITVLYEPADKAQVVADLVFVHGLGGHPELTWRKPFSTSSGEQSRGGGTLATKKTKRSRHAKDTSESEVLGFWPFHLVREDFSNIRTMTYGYDSQHSEGMTISEHGRKLLHSVARKRRDCLGRPLVFVAHSLGGILTKDALWESTKSQFHDHKEALYDVGLSCKTIFFFGTPHRGSQQHTKWAEVVLNFTRYLPFLPAVSTKILHELNFDGEIVDNVARNFNEIRKRYRPRIYNFKEGIGLPNIPHFNGLVVPNFSATFSDDEVSETTLKANHVEMCKFGSAAEEGYQTFKEDLEEALSVVAAERAEKAAQVQSEVDALGDRFDFDERCLRQFAIAEKLLSTTEETFTWIWNSRFASWLRQIPTSDHLFWICGKPASGKSSIMDFVARSAKTTELAAHRFGGHWTVIRHFFDFRGERGTTNNYEGFLRSLAVQLLEDSAQAMIDTSSLSKLLFKHGKIDSRSYAMSVPDLSQAIVAALQTGGGSRIVLLDGLDEYGGDIHFLLDFIGSVASPNCRICMASRPENPLPHRLKDIPTILMQDHNYGAIRTYFFGRLSRSFTEADACHRWAENVAHRSSGVFLWARFAVEKIESGIESGLLPDSQQIREELAAVPNELEEIYAQKLYNLSSTSRGVAGLVLLLIRSCRRSPVTLGFLWQALRSAPVGDQILPQISQAAKSLAQNVSEQGFLKNLNHCASCFVHLHQPGQSKEQTYVVEFNHRTVQTYFEKTAWPQMYGHENMHGLGHHLWLLTCLHMVKPNDASQSMSVWKQFDQGETSESHSKLEDELLHYAVQELPDHAALYEFESGSSSFVLLRGQLPAGLVACDILRAGCTYRVSSSNYGHIIPKCNDFVNRFHNPNYEDQTEADPSTLAEMMVYHGATRYVEDYLRHENSDHQLDPLSSHTGLGDNLFVGRHEGPPRNKTKRSTRTTKGRMFIQSPPSVTASRTLALSQRGLVRRAALRTIFCDFETELPWDHYFEAAKSVLSLTRRIEEIDIVAALFSTNPRKARILREGLSIIRPGRLQLSAHSVLIQAFDESSQTIKSKTSVVGPFWAIGAAFWIDRHHERLANQETIDVFIARGHTINDVCGPYGTIWHSYISGVFSKLDALIDIAGTLKALQRTGANPCQRGIFGNALEFLWKVLHSPKAIWAIRLNATGQRFDRLIPIYGGGQILKCLLELGVSNTITDPNGSIPSVREMKAYLALEEKGSRDCEGEKRTTPSDEWFRMIRHYYGTRSDGTELAEKLLGMDEEALTLFLDGDDYHGWTPHQEQAITKDTEMEDTEMDDAAMDDAGREDMEWEDMGMEDGDFSVAKKASTHPSLTMRPAKKARVFVRSRTVVAKRVVKWTTYTLTKIA